MWQPGIRRVRVVDLCDGGGASQAGRRRKQWSPPLKTTQLNLAQILPRSWQVGVTRNQEVGATRSRDSVASGSLLKGGSSVVHGKVGGMIPALKPYHSVIDTS